MVTYDDVRIPASEYVLKFLEDGVLNEVGSLLKVYNCYYSSQKQYDRVDSDEQSGPSLNGKIYIMTWDFVLVSM